MNFLSWLFLGFASGLLAHLLDPQPREGGLKGAIILGITGALAGGILTRIFLDVSLTKLNLASLLTAVLGSMFLLFISRGVRSS
jgi:uncharacterized membrane protein YeaQ/YmgE (transglycosylase-associated protein family)